MTTDDLPQDVVELLRERLHSFEALEVLIALQSDPRTWRVREIADRLGVDREIIRSALDELRRGGFVVTEPDESWRYAPTDAPTAAAIHRLLLAYRTSRLDLMRRMTENAMERIRSSAATAFADAFRFGKGKRNG